MNNPFSYSALATGVSFCNRAKEQKAIMGDVKNSQNIVLFSHRRMGKTSLLHQVKARLEKAKPKILTVYIDLFGTVSEKDFINALFQGIASLEPRLDRLTKLFGGIKLTMSVDPISNETTFGVAVLKSETEQYLERAMKILDDYSKKRKLMVVFDEFQEISNYENGRTFEKKLRAHIQLQQNISYVFSGSHRHLLMQMFSSADRAFYQMAKHMSLDPIEKSEYVAWAMNLFKKGSRPVEESIVSTIIDRCELQPMSIQHFLYELWKTDQMAVNTVDRIERLVLESRKDTFIILWDSLSVNQKKILQLVIQTGGINVYKAENIANADISTPGVVQRGLEQLVERQVLTKNGGYRFQDVMFKIWVENL